MELPEVLKCDPLAAGVFGKPGGSQANQKSVFFFFFYGIGLSQKPFLGMKKKHTRFLLGKSS